MAQDVKACGPLLRFCGYDPASHLWRGSALLVVRAPRDPLVISLSAPGLALEADGSVIELLHGCAVWRFAIEFRLGEREKRVEYSIRTARGAPIAENHAFYAPAAGEPWHWAAYSCNGLSHGTDAESVGGVATMWTDLVDRHLSAPLHAAIGLGDQIYADGLFRGAPSLAGYFEGRRNGKGIRKGEVTDGMPGEVEAYYFQHYCEHFSSPGMADAMASVPQMMIWDDHDIFDGWGSYPASLQDCPIFQSIFAAARRYYLLFQHHTTAERALESPGTDLFCSNQGACLHFLRLMGPTVALLGLDTRSERTLTQVLSPKSWDTVFDQLSTLPPSVRHLVVALPLPITYPRLPMSYSLLRGLAGLNRIRTVNRMLSKAGWAEGLIAFNEPELLDDLWDQWVCPGHRDERRRLVNRLQSLAFDRQLRITFISGDVHACSVGQFCSHPKVASPLIDPRSMTSVVTSAIINKPPPAGILAAQQFFDCPRRDANRHTHEELLRIFPKRGKVMGRRNWCEVSQASPHLGGGLAFTLWVEQEGAKGRATAPYAVEVPPLEEGYVVLAPGKVETMMDERWFGTGRAQGG
ncbi:unnamed protein product [Ostreobium quekettii]|uniref:PhoD-like phosphatase domain-containing protein n=1 Tax=Ostreobium quekettii TaxID=121088 RepID=A0A8S1JFM1_9CHLO|nr:unnamed protein product [Ostreobium quekettii]|eukprot:evm.model.scf_476.9 EVM.evm.TU.scf_476.9   scf_476:61713-63982(-)